MSLDAARREAARVAASVDLRDVRLWGLRADLEAVPDEEGSRLAYRFNADVEVQHSDEHNVLLVMGTYSLNMKAVPIQGPPSEDAQDTRGDGYDETEGEVATLEFNLNALFQVDRSPDEPFTESELNAFGETTGQFALYPYARELVADLTGRMGLPTLHMGVMRLNMETRDG